MVLNKEQRYALKLIDLLMKQSEKQKRCGRYKDGIMDVANAVQNGDINDVVRRDKARTGTILGRLEKHKRRRRRKNESSGS